LNFSGMGLKHLLFVNIVLLLFNILIGISLGGESLSERLRCLGFWLRGRRKLLANFAMVIGVASIPRTWQNKQFPNVLLFHNNHKKNPRKE
jgi:hypothetical protein